MPPVAICPCAAALLRSCRCFLDWLSWLVPTAGFNPVESPVKGGLFGSIPKPVSTHALAPLARPLLCLLCNIVK